LCMSWKSRTLTSMSIVIVGLFGVWIGSQTDVSEDLRFWVGLTVFIIAFAGLIVMSRRDLRPSEQDKMIEWQQIKARGRARYVLIQILLSQVVWLPVLFGYLFGIFTTRTWRSMSSPPWWWMLLAVTAA